LVDFLTIPEDLVPGVKSLYSNPSIFPGDYIGIKLQGLIGDTIRASTVFDMILEEFPDKKWLVIHAYTEDRRRINTVMDLLDEHIKSGRIAYFFLDNRGKPGKIQPYQENFFKEAGCEKVYDLYILSEGFLEYKSTKPRVSVDISDVKTISNKAVILRHSGFHGHYPERNRSVEEWDIITQALLDEGYEVHLLGYDDIMPNNLNVVDHRKKFTILETLEFAKDAAISISVACFLPVFMQYLTKSLSLTAAADIHNLLYWWRYKENYIPINVEKENYLERVVEEIKQTSACFGRELHKEFFSNNKGG